MKELLDFLKNYLAQFLLVASIAYLLGSISFATIFTKIFDKKDIRSVGSHNAGFTNVLRTSHKKAAVLTLIFDFLKGACAVFFAKLIFEQASYTTPASIVHIGVFLAGLACILGHIYPCFFSFRGGKGVLTSSAIIAMVDFRIFILLLASFLLCFIISKIVSLSSIVAAIALPFISFFITYVFDYLPVKDIPHSSYGLFYVITITVISAVASTIVILKHSSNISRLLKGEEAKISIRSKKQ